MSEKKAVTVTIYGNEYTMKGEADPAYISELAKYVDAKMNEIGKKSSAPAAKVAILASMNIADEFHRLEKAKADHLKLIETLERSVLEMKKSADGSLKHTLELREHSDQLKAEVAEDKKKLEEAIAESSKGKKESEDLRRELERAKKDLESASRKHEETSKESTKLREELQTMKPQLDKLKADLEAAEGLNDEAQSELQDLRAKSEHFQGELTRNKQNTAQAASFLPSDDKVNALFKKIDAILE